MTMLRRGSVLVALLGLLGGCALNEPSRPDAPRLTAAEGRALVGSLLPKGVTDRAGWATDIYAAMAVLDVPPRIDNICAIVAITEQETGFRVDPAIPNLPALAWQEIERQRERAGIPKLVLNAALALDSSDGRSYRERIDSAKTELQLSDAYEDLIGRVPLARTFLEERNPVRTGGPMQVSVAFAKTHAAARPYPYPVADSLRHEVFTRRGGMYFGIAHLLDYPAPYEGLVYRFADFNAGHYASRNAAFQKALTELSGVPLALDGDLLRFDKGKTVKEPGSTELAARVLARRLDLSPAEIRRDLEKGALADFERSALYRRVFEAADAASPKPVPRAVVPTIALQSAKFTRKLTTEWFARRVAERHRACVGRGSTLLPPNPAAIG